MTIASQLLIENAYSNAKTYVFRKGYVGHPIKNETFSLAH